MALGILCELVGVVTYLFFLNDNDSTFAISRNTLAFSPLFSIRWVEKSSRKARQSCGDEIPTPWTKISGVDFQTKHNWCTQGKI